MLMSHFSRDTLEELFSRCQYKHQFDGNWTFPRDTFNGSETTPAEDGVCVSKRQIHNTNSFMQKQVIILYYFR